MSAQLLKVEVELGKLNRALPIYQRLSGKMPEEVLLKQGTELGFRLARELRGIAPPKGSIRQQRLEALKAGEGVLVRKRVRNRILAKYTKSFAVNGNTIEYLRPSVMRKGKRLNLQALMVQAELNLREKGRGFLGQSSRYPRLTNQTNIARSVYGLVLSRAGLEASKEVLRFNWDSSRNELQSSAVKGLSKPKAESAITRGISGTLENMRAYIRRKLGENARKAGLQ